MPRPRAVPVTFRRQSVDDRQVELGVVGTELVDDRARSGRSGRASPMRPMPIGWRSAITTASVPGNIRRIDASATHGDMSSFCRQLSRSAVTMLVPRQPSSSASTSPRDMPLLPLHRDARHRQRVRRQHETDGAIQRERRRRGTRSPTRASVHHDGRHHRRLRAGLTCARRNRLSAGAATGISDAPPACERLHQPLRQRANRAGAQRDHRVARVARFVSSVGHHVVQRFERRAPGGRIPFESTPPADRP